MKPFHFTNRLLITTLFCELLLVSTSALSCSSDEGNDGEGDKQLEWLDPIRVASYNIQYDNRNEEAGRWENRKEMVCRLLEAEDFDLIGAQEPYRFQIEEMAAALPGYAWIGTSVTGEDDAVRRHFNPIFYKTDKLEVLENGAFWYSETPHVPNTKFADSYSPRMCNWAHFRVKATGREFFLFNSHFDHIGTVARAESAKLLIEKVAEIAGSLPALCTGDFNSNQQTSVYTTIATSGILADSYARTTERIHAEWPSYNGYKYISTPPARAMRIDHIFVTKGRTKVQSWRIVTTGYAQKYPSDHFPVVIEWSFAK